MADITTLSNEELQQALGYSPSHMDITKLSDDDLMKSIQPADESPAMKDAQWGQQHPYLRSLQTTGNEAIVNPLVQGANAVAPAIRGIAKGIGADPGGQDIQGPDMSNAPMAAKVLGDVAAGGSQGLAATGMGAGNPILGYAALSGLGAYGRGEQPIPAAIKGATNAIPQMIAGKVGSSLASAAIKNIGGMVSKFAPNVGTALGMGGAAAAQAVAAGQNPVEAAASGASFGLLSPMNPLGTKTVVTPEAHDAILENQGAPLYRNILNPGKGIIKSVEIKSGGDINDSMKLAAKDALPINSAEGKLDNRAAMDQIKQTTAPMYDEQNKILASNPDKQFNLQDIGDQVKAGLSSNEKSASDLAADHAKVDNEINAEILRHGENVDGQTLNMIKQGMWGKSYNPLEPNANDGARAIGFGMKDAIEKAYPDQTIMENNQKIGQYLQLQRILEATHGQIVQGGKIGKYAAKATGAVVGGVVGSHIPVLGEVVGPIAGMEAGGRVNDFMNDPARLTANWAKKINGYQINNPNPIETRRPGAATPEVMNGPEMPETQRSISMNPVPGIGYDPVEAQMRLRRQQVNNAPIPPLGTKDSFGNPYGQKGAFYTVGNNAVRGPSNSAINPVNINPKTSANNGPAQPNMRAQFDMSKGGTPEGIPEPFVTPNHGTPEHIQTYPQSNINPLANVQKGSAADPLGKKIAPLAIAGAIGIGSVFNPINSQAATVKDPERLKLPAAQYTMKNEGWKGMPYLDTNGNKAVGYGFKQGGMAWKYVPDDVKQGRRAMTKEEGISAFNKAYPSAVQAAQNFAGDHWGLLSSNQQKSLTDMAYQMGSIPFPKLKEAIQSGNYNTASREILNSKYAKKDAPQRALQNAVLMQG